MQYLIEDMFQTITLFDNQAVEPKVTPEGARYRVELTVDTRKLRADGLGKETEIGVNGGKTNFDFAAAHRAATVRERSCHGITRVSIVDRNPEDNWMPVSGAGF